MHANFGKDDDTPLKPITSPVIIREGNRSQVPPNDAMTAGEWVQARYNIIAPNYSKRIDGKDIGSTMVGNIEVKSYA
jgi:hypothetical protein